jgi:hypothetical protein
MSKSPLKKVKEDFGNKDKLVDEILALIKRPSDLTKDQFKKKLRAQSNKKLMTLLAREKTVKERYGSREKLIDAITKDAKGEKKSGDKEYKKQLASKTTGQLLDLASR